jgi:hypothetical protein
MLEIQPLSPAYPVIKPDKIKRDNKPTKQSPENKKLSPDESESDISKHIDEMV